MFLDEREVLLGADHRPRIAGQGDYGPKIRGSSVLSDPKALENLLRTGKNKMPPVGATWDDRLMNAAIAYLKSRFGARGENTGGG